MFCPVLKRLPCTVDGSGCRGPHVDIMWKESTLEGSTSQSPDTRRSSQNSETTVASTGPPRVSSRSSAVAVSSVFSWDSYPWEQWVSWSFCLLLGLFPPVGCFVRPQCEGFCYVLLYFVLSCLVVISQRPALFWWETKGKGVWGSPRRMGKVQGGETVVGDVF